jgi:hypothetical protein
VYYESGREEPSMAVSAMKCVACGRPLDLFSGMAVNGGACHDQCWDRRVTPVPQDDFEDYLGELEGIDRSQ